MDDTDCAVIDPPANYTPDDPAPLGRCPRCGGGDLEACHPERAPELAHQPRPWTEIPDDDEICCLTCGWWTGEAEEEAAS